MPTVFSSKKTIVIGIVVFILSLMEIEIFADQGWELKTQLSTERITFATAVVGNKIYLIGGTLYADVKPGKAVRGPYGISIVEVYDTQTNTWQRVADMPTPRHGAKAAVVNGTIFVFGGWNGKDGNFANRKYPVSVEAYNPQTDTWIQKKEMPVSRVEFDIGVVDGRIYIIGGAIRRDGGGERIGRVDVYDPATDTWVEGREMPTPRSNLGVGVVSNRIYAIGGRGWPPIRIGPHLTVIEEYDSRSRQWRKRGDMLDTRDSFATVVVRDSIYLIGGTILAGVPHEFLASVNVYDPQEDTWDEIPAMPIPLVPNGAAAVNGKIYVFGGSADVGKGWELLPDVVVYDTGFRAVTAQGKLPIRWGELKAKHRNQP